MKYFYGMHPQNPTVIVLKNGDRGAIALEYGLGMMLAAFLMIGINLMFRIMAIEIIDYFKQLVMQFPNI
ncbi:MAG: hypothetical protein R2861_02465 [Desulfobacterales bacterium]